MKSTRLHQRSALNLLLAALSWSAVALCSHADEREAGRQADTWNVANYGLDTGGCGKRRAPCRSITQALSLARDGDTILVGPGRYGDVNRDGDLDDAGEEARTLLGIREGCAVCIDKRIRLISTDGATATVIDAGMFVQAGSTTRVIRIFSDGVEFGAKRGGFTITGAQLGIHSQAGDVTISGNLVLHNPDAGLNVFAIGGPVHVSHNTVTGSEFAGLLIRGIEGTAVVTSNTAVGNPGPGFFITETALVTDNVSSSNGIGFLINGEGMRFQRNVASGNEGAGFLVSDNTDFTQSHFFILNTVTGNGGAGFFFGADAHPSRLRGNNIFGNLLGNCGLHNESRSVIDARNNFWGSANGPGPDPADNAGSGSGCIPGGGVETLPFAMQPFPISFTR